MKLRKLFALLTALIMLLGMMPTASATLVGCNHDWRWEYTDESAKDCRQNNTLVYHCTICGKVDRTEKEPGPCVPSDKWVWDGRAPTNCGECGIKNQLCKYCGQPVNEREEAGPHKWKNEIVRKPACDWPGWKESFCTVCGESKEDGQSIPATGHKWSSWKADVKRTCTEGGYEHRDCTVCGLLEERKTNPYGHDYTNFELTKEPTCTEYGRKVGECSRCGAHIAYNVKMIDHVFGEWVIIREATPDKPGLREKKCVMCGLPVQEEFRVGEENEATNDVVNDIAVVVVSALPVYPNVGDSFVVDLRVTNTGDTILSYAGTTLSNSDSDILGTPAAGGVDINKLNPGESFIVPVTVTVTDADQALNYVERAFTVQMNVWANEKVGFMTPVNKDTENDVSYPINVGLTGSASIAMLMQEETVELPTVELVKTIDSVPANGEYFVPGEEIRFSLTMYVYGPGETIFSEAYQVDQAEIHDPLLGEVDLLVRDDPAYNMGHSFLYTVTEEDAARGYVENTGYATWIYQENGETGRVESNTVTALCGFDELEFVAAPGLELTLTLASTPANGTHFVLGEEVTFVESWVNNTSYTLDPFAVYTWTCHEPVYGSEIDQLSSCWFSDDGPVVPGATGSHSLTVIVTEADVARSSIYACAETSAAVQNGSDLENVLAPYVTAPCGPGELPEGYVPPSNVDAQIDKYVVNEPANGEFFVPGETIEYAVVFMNQRNHELHDVEVYDPLKGSNEDITIAREPVVEPNGTLFLNFSYVVTEEDAARGTVVNTASALWLNPEIEEWSSCDSNTVTTAVGFGNRFVIVDIGLSDDLAVTKTELTTPANGMFYVPGEKVEFSVNVKNNGAPLDNLHTQDWMWDTIYVFGTINTNEDVTYFVPYTVTELDAIAGFVSNVAMADAINAHGETVIEYSNVVTVPCGFADGNAPFGTFDSVALVKKEESMPLNGKYYTEGEVIHYSITYTNDGEQPLTDVEIWDALDITNPIASAEMLNPGESRVCYYQYTVSASDVEFGSVINLAFAGYYIPGGEGYVNSYSNVVISDTDGQPDDMASNGTIDTDQMRSGEASCMRTVTGRDNASVSYDVSFCEKHADVQSAVMMMEQVSASPEMQMQSAAYAVAMWRNAVDALYQEVYAAADPVAKINVMAEYIRFLTEVANYETMLKQLYADNPALIARKVAAMWESKCVDFCCDIHTGAAARKDSLLSVIPAAGAEAVACTCENADAASGSRTSTQYYCPAHSYSFAMLDLLLQGQDTAEAWDLVRQIWTVELNNAYGRIAAKLGEQHAVVLVEYSTLSQWMEAREAVLTLLYPDNPELVAQMMVKLVMDRVNDLCQAAK